jgi:hypothetical protein
MPQTGSICITFSFQAVEKQPSAAFLSSFVIATYVPVRRTPQDFEGPRKRDFAGLNLHLDIFEQPVKIIFSTTLFF